MCGTLVLLGSPSTLWGLPPPILLNFAGFLSWLSRAPDFENLPPPSIGLLSSLHLSCIARGGAWSSFYQPRNISLFFFSWQSVKVSAIGIGRRLPVPLEDGPFLPFPLFYRAAQPSSLASFTGSICPPSTGPSINQTFSARGLSFLFLRVRLARHLFFFFSIVGEFQLGGGHYWCPAAVSGLFSFFSFDPFSFLVISPLPLLLCPASGVSQQF